MTHRLHSEHKGNVNEGEEKNSDLLFDVPFKKTKILLNLITQFNLIVYVRATPVTVN